MNLSLKDKVARIVLPKRNFISYMLKKSYKQVDKNRLKAELEKNALELHYNDLCDQRDESEDRLKQEKSSLKDTLDAINLVKKDDQEMLVKLASQQVHYEKSVELFTQEFESNLKRVENIGTVLSEAKYTHDKLTNKLREIDNRIKSVKAMDKAQLVFSLLKGATTNKSLEFVDSATNYMETTRQENIEKVINNSRDNETQERINQIIAHKNNKEITT